MASIFIDPFVDVGSGITPADGALLYFFALDAVTPKDTFSLERADPGDEQAHPVEANAAGVFPEIWIEGSYVAVLKDKNEVQQWQSQPFSSVVLPVSSEITYNEGSTGAVDRTVESKLQERVTVEDFDDGIKTDTVILKEAFAAMPTNGGLIAFRPGKEYSFDPSAAFGINLQSLTNFTILGNGATIKCIDSAPNVGDGVIAWFENCEDGEINDLVFDGNLPTRTGGTLF